MNFMNRLYEPPKSGEGEECVCVCVCVCRGRSAPKLNPIDPSASRMGVEQVQSPASWWYCDVRWFMIGHKIVFIFFFPTK